MSGIGKSIDELKNNFTIDQIFHLYGECRKADLENWKMDAEILAHAIAYASPTMSSDKNLATKRYKTWRKFLNLLTWEKLEQKQEKKQTASSFLNMFKRTGLVPIQTVKSNKDGAK